MGEWGMGITQSDEYCEVYEKFMNSYNAGMETAEITQNILEEYYAQFSCDDGVLHDVYFAIAKAQWMCGGVSADILAQVERIVESGSNVEFYRDRETQSQDLELRRKNLDRFLKGLKTSRGIIRKRTPEPKQKELPFTVVGGVYSYKDGEKTRLFIVLDHVKRESFVSMLFCGILKNSFASVPTPGEIMNEYIGAFGLYSAVEFLPSSRIKLLYQVNVSDNKYNEIFGTTHLLLRERQDFWEVSSDNHHLTLERLLTSNRGTLKHLKPSDFLICKVWYPRV